MQSAANLVAKLKLYIIDPAILIVFSAGFFLFIYGLVEFMWKLNQGEDTKEGKMHMVWGIVGMLVMVSVYGILALLDNTFGLGALNGTQNTNSINTINVTGSFQ